jgi:phosphate transport system permease protein
MAVTAATIRSTTSEVERSLTKPDRHLAGNLLTGSLLFTLLFTIAVLITLLLRLIGPSLIVFRERGMSFFTESIGSEPDAIGIWPGLYGSFFIALGVLVFAIPTGVAAAIYLEEYAKPSKLNSFIMVNIRNLAGVPAVIYGVLGLIIFAEWGDGITGGKTTLAAACTMAVLVLPVVIITSSEAIRAVPQSLREAGFGIGSTRWEVTRDHVMPYATPGILTGTMLSLARALGEAAPLILLGAITGLLPTTGLTDKFSALPMLIYSWSGRPPEGQDLDWANVAAAAGVVLLGLVLVFNIVAVIARNRFERKRSGS